jgi:hypothetical protein
MHLLVIPQFRPYFRYYFPLFQQKSTTSCNGFAEMKLWVAARKQKNLYPKRPEDLEFFITLMRGNWLP